MTKREQAPTSTSAGRVRHERNHPRVSPYPTRNGSTFQEPLPSGPSVTTATFSSQAPDLSKGIVAAESTRSDVLPLPVTNPQQYDLRVQPIVKETVAQRDSSGNSLDSAVFSGNSFREIKKKLWNVYGPQVRVRTVKTAGVWSAQQRDEAHWAECMQFKVKKHIVDNSKTDQAWHQWLVKTRGQTVTLLVYKFGSAISRAQDLQALAEACALVRATATAQVSLKDIVVKLRKEWGSTFQAADVVWTMWGNHIKKNLFQSTLAEAIDQLPPSHVEKFLRLVHSPQQMHVSNVKQSMNMALVVVQQSLEDNQLLRHDFETLKCHLEEQERQLKVRRSTLEAIHHELGLPTSRSERDAA